MLSIKPTIGVVQLLVLSTVGLTLMAIQSINKIPISAYHRVLCVLEVIKLYINKRQIFKPVTGLAKMYTITYCVSHPERHIKVAPFSHCQGGTYGLCVTQHEYNGVN